MRAWGGIVWLLRGFGEGCCVELNILGSGEGV